MRDDGVSLLSSMEHVARPDVAVSVVVPERPRFRAFGVRQETGPLAACARGRPVHGLSLLRHHGRLAGGRRRASVGGAVARTSSGLVDRHEEVAMRALMIAAVVAIA